MRYITLNQLHCHESASLNYRILVSNMNHAKIFNTYIHWLKYIHKKHQKSNQIPLKTPNKYKLIKQNNKLYFYGDFFDILRLKQVLVRFRSVKIDVSFKRNLSEEHIELSSWRSMFDVISRRDIRYDFNHVCAFRMIKESIPLHVIQEIFNKQKLFLKDYLRLVCISESKFRKQKATLLQRQSTPLTIQKVTPDLLRARLLNAH